MWYQKPKATRWKTQIQVFAFVLLVDQHAGHEPDFQDAAVIVIGQAVGTVPVVWQCDQTIPVSSEQAAGFMVVFQALSFL